MASCPRRTPRLILAADTVVVQGDRILGKPEDEAEAREMLKSLSGSTHAVLTGICLLDPVRGVSLVGVSSENCPYDIRAKLWQRLATEWKPRHLESICQREIRLSELRDVFKEMLAGKSAGRTVVKLFSESASK